MGEIATSGTIPISSIDIEPMPAENAGSEIDPVL